MSDGLEPADLRPVDFDPELGLKFASQMVLPRAAPAWRERVEGVDD